MTARTSIRHLAKGTIERILGGTVAGALTKRRMRGLRIVLAWHNIVPTETPRASDRSLHCSLDQFRSQLDTLERRTRILSLDELLGDRGESPAAALTFDDAYAGAVTLGLRELSSRSLPATVFVTPSLLGSGVPWWDALATDEGLEDRVRLAGLEENAGVTERVREMARQSGMTWRTDDDRLRIASESELLEGASLPGMTLGAHSWSHPNLVRVSDAELGREIAPVLPWLKARFGDRTRSWFAYPYGLSDERVREATRAAGYSAGFLVTGGWHHPSVDPMALPRLNVPAGLSASGLAARLNGFLGTLGH